MDQDSQENLRPEDIARQIYADAGPLGGSHFDDLFDTQTIEEDEPVDLRDEGETPDEYWSKGWVLDFCSIKRSDYDSHNGRYHRVFPTRYRLIDSVPTRSQRRVLADNADLEFVIRPLRITPAKEDLNFRHQMARFGDPPKSLSARYEYIIYYPSRLMELCCFLGEELIAFSIFEVGQTSIWSNLCCWSPGHLDRSLGILTVLKEMEYARSFGAQHYYMGHYYIHDPVYAYKTRFAGLEFYDWDNDEWLDYNDPAVPQLLSSRLHRRSESE